MKKKQVLYSKMDGLYIGSFILAALIIVVAVFYAIDNVNKRNKNCSNIPKPVPLQNLTKEDATYQKPLRDFFVKSSYNSCASGKYKNDWVDLCALSNAIKSGCRLLDFEIYDVKGVPVVAVSDSPKFTLKHSYNSIPLDKVLKRIEDEAFSGDVNGADPLFLNFRIKSDHVELCDEVAKLLTSQRNGTLASRLLSSDFSYEYQGQNFAKVPLNTLCQKVIIMASENKRISESKLAEFVNVAPSPLFRVIPFNSLASQDLTDLTAYTKTRLAMITPFNSDNYTSASGVTLGVQFNAMNFQTNDNNLKAYNEQFVKNGNRAFYLKSEPYKQTEIPDAKPLPKDSEFGTTVYENKYLSFSL
jgi:hypothetical protein